MHPFSLNEEQINQVGGGMKEPPLTTLAIGEEGGDLGYLTGKDDQTTMAIGEEGGGVPPAV